jgi:UDP-2-acetamido-3-amino-2,3-dideoxy-glucuronate N-acetyltransferase
MADPDHRHIHATAIVEPGAQIGAGTQVWHWVHVMNGAHVGERCSIGQGCFVGNVVIGDGCRIQNHVSIYDGVTLEPDVFIGPSAVFTNVMHPRAHVPRKDAYEATRICRGATIGANATILCGVVVGAHAMIGAGAVVVDDVKPHAVMVGVPARQISWACACGETLFADFSCGRCESRYRLDDGEIVSVDKTA